MTSKQTIRLLLTISAVCLIAFVGCSEKSFITKTNQVAPTADPVAFIPLNQGLRIEYVDLEPETDHYDIEIVNPVIIAGHSGFTFRRTDRQTNEINTWYQYSNGVAIFQTSSLNDPGMRILESPFVAGNSWNIYDTSSTTTGSGGGNNNDPADDEVGKGDDWTTFGDTWKILPDGEFNTMTIVGFESVEAMNGTSYGNCLKVQWQTDSLSSNFYWYASGIGLIKFESRSESSYQSGNNTVTVMTDFQTVQY